MWERGDPDLVLKPAAEHTVAAGAAPSVRRVEIETAFRSPRRVHGLAFKPTDRRVVRYATISESGTGRWLFTWTPWFTTFHLPEGVAYVLPAGAKLDVEIGYQGTEEAVADQSEVGLYLDEAASGGTAVVQTSGAPALDLAAGAGPTKTRGELVLPETTAIQAIWPEPGPGAVSVEVTAFLPDGIVRPLLWLRGHHADWPSPYVYTDPVPLPRGTRVVMTVHAANAGDTPRKVEPRLTIVRVPTASTTF
jgi:hypothetical protein